MTIYDEIGETIVSARKEKKFTQEQLALECGISVSYLRCIEHGSANPTINELCLIAKALQLELRNPLAVPATIGARL
ncbi:MAG: helix-turn-helix transcriptional regulator [Anaerotruncus sp.]|nr:helix-turn-helix transcriptional regulator [Anaerotruncus sp.]